jgi:hypothetical protein
MSFAGKGHLGKMMMAVTKKSGTENSSRSGSIDWPIISFPGWIGEAGKAKLIRSVLERIIQE